MQPLDPPTLTTELSKYYGGCTFVSITLISALRDLLPPQPHLVLSIGSGLGLVEALITQDGAHLIECIEVPGLRDERKYTQETSMHYVKGSWDTCDRAVAATVWMFMFPRDPRLLAKYIERYENGKIQMILWSGPVGDAADVKAAVSNRSYFVEDRSFAPPVHASEAMLLWRRGPKQK